MAEQATAKSPETATKPDEASAPAVEAPAVTADAVTEGVTALTTDETAKPATDEDKPASAEAAPTTTAPTTADAQPTAETSEPDHTEKMDTDATPSTPAPATPATGASKKKGGRKSIGGDKSTKKAKQAPVLHLDVKPGEYWWGRMKGFPDWPVIIWDQDKLPEILITKRPVSAVRVDGTYREDFQDGGKNAKDRRYPVMFLASNDFAWVVNTELNPLDMAKVQEIVKNEDKGKRSKLLWQAYEAAAENKSLDYWNNLILEHEKAAHEEMAAEEEERVASEQAKKTEKAPKKGKRKSTAGADGDLEMEDASGESGAAPKKASKKRKASDSDTEEKPAKTPKTPKTKLKVNGPKTPAEDSTTKPKKAAAAKPKKSAKKTESEDEPAEKSDAKPMTEAEKLEKREKAILYLRHRLQKGFLTRDQMPKEDEMTQMSEYLTQLEAYKDLEVHIIKLTKINKVLKAIIKLNTIPKDNELHFKRRSTDLLATWNNAMAAEPASEPNGHKEDAKSPAAEESKTDEAQKTDAPAADGTSKDVEMKDETSAEPVETSNSLGDKAGDEGDVAMEDTKPTEPKATKPEATEAEETAEKDAEKDAGKDAEKDAEKVAEKGAEKGAEKEAEAPKEAAEAAA